MGPAISCPERLGAPVSRAGQRQRCSASRSTKRCSNRVLTSVFMAVNIHNSSVKTIFLNFAPMTAVWFIALFYLLPVLLSRYLMIVLMRSEGRTQLSGFEVQMYLIPMVNLITLIIMLCFFIHDTMKNRFPWLMNWFYGRPRNAVAEERTEKGNEEPY